MQRETVDIVSLSNTEILDAKTDDEKNSVTCHNLLEVISIFGYQAMLEAIELDSYDASLW